MTIIEPHKNKYFAKDFLLLGILVLVLAGLNIYFYNMNVSLRFSAGTQERAAQVLESRNAELRNELFRTLDSKNLSSLIEEYNFIQDKTPDYLEHKGLANR